MSVMRRSDFPSDLEQGLNTHFGLTYRRLAEEWKMAFDTSNSSKAFEEDVLNYGFGAAPVRDEGDALDYDSGGEAWTARYTMEEVAMGFAITKVAIEDNLYGNLSARYAPALARSMVETKEIKAASVYNNATSGSYLGGDGVALLSTAHPLAGGGTFSNKLATPADISESALEDILIQIRKAVDDRNLPIALRSTRLLIPPEREFDVERILKSVGRPGTGDNDINALRNKGMLQNPPAVMTRFTDTDAWFVRTDAPDGMKYFNRISMQRGMEGDFETDNMRFKARERYVFGWTDPRAVYGSEGAA